MTTLERLSNILATHYKIDPARLTLHEPLEQLGIDSLGMAELLFFIEDEFRVQLPGDAPLLPTLADAVRYVDGLVAAQHAPQSTTSESPALPATPPPPA